MAYLGAETVDVRPGACDIALGLRPELGQQHGFFHGGLIGALSDNACGYAAYTLAPPRCSILTVEYKVNIVAPRDGERLIARSRVVKPGRTLVVCSAETFVIKDGRERLYAAALETLMLVVGRPDAPGTER